MPVPNIKQLQDYINQRIEISIYGGQEEEVPPFVQKEIRKIEHCPDGTHMRFYFDLHYFIAIPISSESTIAKDGFTAFDPIHQLNYSIKKI